MTAWPPRPSQVFSAYGFHDTDASAVRLIGIIAAANSSIVTFNGRHERGGCRFQLETVSEELAGELRIWLSQHIGKTLREIGELEFGDALSDEQ